MRKDLFRKSLVAGIIVLFVGASVVPFVGSSNNIKTNLLNVFVSDWPCDPDIIVPDDYPTIQQAIDAAEPGFCIGVRAGTYYENVVIDKEGIILCGENRNTTIIDGGGSGDVVYVSANEVNISGFRIQNSGQEGGWRYVDAGILLHSNWNTILNNNISYNLDGVFVSGSNNNTISDNIFLSNSWVGIDLFECYGNTVSDNSFFNDGFMVFDAFQSNFSNNTVNDKPVVYLEEESNKVILDDAGQVILIECDNITIQNQEISHIQHGILLYGTDNSIIINNNISSNKWYGIFLAYSRNNIIYNNTLSNNNISLYLRYSSNKNIISYNNISKSKYEGIYLRDSSNNNIISNNNFLCNERHAFDESGNQWDNGSVGNYWDNYLWNDNNGDGIGDMPFPIPPYIYGNIDRYPIVGKPKYDCTPPEVRINKPADGYRYFKDHKLWPCHNGKTIIWSIGGFQVEVYSIDYESNICRVEFYIDNESKPREIECNQGRDKIYSWYWDETMLGEEHTIKAIAYDVAGNNAPADPIDVLVWNIHLPGPP